MKGFSMKYIILTAFFVAFLHGSTAYAHYCQCTSSGLQDVNCIEVVSKDIPCDSNCECKAGRVCLGGWCYGKASKTNCISLLGLQTFCQESPEAKCNPNILNPNCQCSSGRVCSSYGYCVGQSENIVVTLFDIDDFIEEE